MLEQKFKDSSELYTQFILKSKELENNIGSGNIKLKDAEPLLVLCKEIEEFYNKITEFCLINRDKETMAEFDVRTATSLLPTMTGEEAVTTKLIDSLEFYSSNLLKDHEQLLINFVLKTRLSESAKLRLNSRYNTCAEFISDMKKHLLTKQSATALQVEMMRTKQGSLSIDEFGNKLENLFVKLAISQANGDKTQIQF